MFLTTSGTTNYHNGRNNRIFLLIMLTGEVLEWEQCRTLWKMGYRILICGRESIETALIEEIL